MKNFVYNKLVRDKIPAIIRRNGGIPSIAPLSAKRFLQELKKKLFEEGKELADAKGKEMVREELSDVLEVLQGIASAKKISWKAVLKKQKEKNVARGGFKKRIFLRSVKE